MNWCNMANRITIWGTGGLVYRGTLYREAQYTEEGCNTKSYLFIR